MAVNDSTVDAAGEVNHAYEAGLDDDIAALGDEPDAAEGVPVEHESDDAAEARIPTAPTHHRRKAFDIAPWINRLKEYEDAIRGHDDASKEHENSAVRWRWHSGRLLLSLRKGRRLPNNTLELLAATFSVSRSDLNARMKLAAKFSTEEELSTVIESYRTWTAIKNQALTDRPRGKKKKEKVTGLQTVVAILDECDAAEFGSGDYALFPRIEAGLARLKAAYLTLHADAFAAEM